MKRLIVCAVDPTKYVDVSTTGTSDNDEYLSESGRQYKLTRKNRKGEIQYMSPNEYFYKCATDIFHVPVSKLEVGRRRDEDSLNWQKQQIQNGNKLPLPYINYSSGGQEGLHRMMALGDTFGWDTKFPVLVIDVADRDKENIDYLYRLLSKSVNEAKEYQYPVDKLVSYFQAQVQFEFEGRLDDDEEYQVAVEDSGDYLKVYVPDYEDDVRILIAKDDMRLREPDDDDDFDIDEYIENLDADEFENMFLNSKD